MNPIDDKLTNSILACLFAALISIGAYIAFPLPGTPVPIVLQNMFIMIAALVLGPWWGLATVFIYLLLGAGGMPVFSGGTGGFMKFVGPTGGYLFGYMPAAVAIGFIALKGKGTLLANILACSAGMAIVYLFGVVQLKFVLNSSWGKAITAGFLPFVIGDIIKIVLAAVLAPKLIKGLEHLSERESDG
ncbi:MAG: biotin transporter BioY [Spirochaetia bacterium]|nr:biotin transporter BioY [Spirochaetia bacterium]